MKAERHTVVKSDKVSGAKTEGGEKKSKVGAKVSNLKVDEMLLINIGSTSLGGKIISVKGDVCRI